MIKEEHLLKNSDGKVELDLLEHQSHQGKSRHIYWRYWVTVKLLTDEIRKVRQTQMKSFVQLPLYLSRDIF